jgi:hypothetical protein
MKAERRKPMKYLLLILPLLLLAGCQAFAAVSKIGADVNRSTTQTVMGPQTADDEALPR